MQKKSQATEAAVIRLLLMDQHRKQVVLCKHPDGLYWLLPCGLLPEHQTPLEHLNTLAQESLPEAALAALSGQLEANKPVAWIYPAKESLPDLADVLQVVYLLTLSPEQLSGKSVRSMLHGEICRFWSLDQLPDDLSPLDEVLIQTVRFAEARQALPIDMREARPAPSISVYEIEGVSAIAETRTLVEASAITSPAEARKAASTIQAACVENWNGRAFNVYCKYNLAEEYGTRITRARMREGNLQVYGLDEGRWITNPAIVYQMI